MKEENLTCKYEESNKIISRLEGKIAKNILNRNLFEKVNEKWKQMLQSYAMKK